MAASSIFLIQAFVIVAVPVVLLRISGLKEAFFAARRRADHMLGIALGPSFLGQSGPELTLPNVCRARLRSLVADWSPWQDTVTVNDLRADFRPASRSCHFQRQGGACYGRWPAPPMFCFHDDSRLSGPDIGSWRSIQRSSSLSSQPRRIHRLAMGISLSMTALPVLGAILGKK